MTKIKSATRILCDRGVSLALDWHYYIDHNVRLLEKIKVENVSNENMNASMDEWSHLEW